MSDESYWQESFEIAFEEVGRFDLVQSLTREQREEIGKSLSISHENYGLCHYSPSPSDFYDRIDREWETKYKRLEKEFEAYRGNAETAVKRALNQRSDANVSIGEYGQVTRWDGRSDVIQY